MIDDPHIPGNIRHTKAYANARRRESAREPEDADVEDNEESDERTEVRNESLTKYIR